MQRTSIYRLLRLPILACAVLFFCTSSSQGQSVASNDASSGYNWKPSIEINQIIQAELAAAEAVLVQPNLTDWTTAMMEAYRSYLTFAQVDLQQGKDNLISLNKAYDWIKTETVPDPPSRAMVMDDMKAKQAELILKLSYN
jgi:hypothetical protein